ncbi:hypothetical protein EST38_g9538 [Candolleomyces aberdarensis]|uniref:GED domain-containing protein n=1 Tax=Candolleomyces aberdarensis TaxID=2316362 RepID=A0A4Q2DC02_9AGAR|nr:hypothetical protein EST38_g9538 [Candolleomyces aberdarensis]
MKARLNTLIGQATQELNSYGDAAVYGDKNQQGSLILRLMTQFARDYVSSIEGTKVDISTKELSGGARIYYIFNDVFGHALGSIDATGNLDNQDIRTAIRNSTGPRPSLFVPEVAFDLLVKPQIKLLEAPSLRCVELVYEELVKICHNCTSAELQRFPRLHAQLIETVSELLRERLGPTSDYAQSLIEIQAAYINTNHPAFIAGSALAPQQTQPQAKQLPPPPTNEHVNGYGNGSGEEDEDDQSDDVNGINGIFPPRDGRSVSSNLHDRSRSASAMGGASKRSSSKSHHKEHAHRSSSGTHSLNQGSSSRGSQQAGYPTGGGHHQHQSNVNSSGLSTTSSSPSTARETFLNYFFGQNGPGPVAGSSVMDRAQQAINAQHHQHHHGHGGAVEGGMFAPTGRDVTGAEPAISSGLMAGKRNIDGNNAAYDMKSLGKHIEAVSADGSSLSAREEMETNLIRSLISSYFHIVRQSIQDLIPKAIMHLLVNHTSQQVQNRLVASLYKPDLFGELLNEDEALVAERTRVKALLDAYKDAFKTLSEVGLKST